MKFHTLPTQPKVKKTYVHCTTNKKCNLEEGCADQKDLPSAFHARDMLISSFFNIPVISWLQEYILKHASRLNKKLS